MSSIGSRGTGRPGTRRARRCEARCCRRHQARLRGTHNTSAISPAQWRDSSLGCPQRGMSYTPAFVSGYEVKLRDGERDHIVHVAGGRAVICSSQSETKLSPALLVSATLKAAAAVRTALAAHLGIEPARIRIVSTRPSRSAPPCAASPAEPKGAAFIVEAEAAARTFRYYADDARALNCDRAGENERLRRFDDK